MATCRDWLATLWSASYKGVPIYTERTEQEAGRRLVVHEFPFRDDPFVEDLGERASSFSVSAYVASETADTQAGGLAAVLASSGPGLLVLPTHGPILVRCESFRRVAEKDRHGYIAFDCKFVREGASGALISAPFLGQMVFAAVATVVSAVVAGFASSIAVKGAADFVGEGTTEAIEDFAASVEAIRTQSVVDPAVSAATRDAAADLFAAATTGVDRINGVDPAIASSMLSITRDLAEGMDATDAATAFSSLVSDFPDVPIPTGATRNQTALARNRAVVARTARVASVLAYAEALARRTFESRQEGITARADAAEIFEAEIAAADDADVIVGLQRTRGALVEYLSATITTLAPVVEVEAPRTMPSLWWAWRLYGDPTRSDEIVSRNQLKHASFVPLNFEALAN